MNKILNKLRRRNIKSNIKQFLSVIFIVLLSTMLLSGFITNSYTLESTINTYFEKTNLADLWIYTDKVTAADEEFLTSNQIEYDKRLYFETTAEINTLKTHNSAKVYVYKGKVSTPYVETGKKGCLIDKNVAQNHNIRAGFDNINFFYTINFQGQDITLEFEERLTGTMSLDECADSYSSWAILIDEEIFLQSLQSKLAEKVDGFSAEMVTEISYNQILLKTDNVETTSNLIKAHYEKPETTSRLIYLFGRESVESVQLLTEEIEQSKKIIYVFPIIFLLVSVLIILTTIDQLVIQERKRIGILKACGVPNKKILRHYSHYGSILCAIGAAIGSVLGLFLMPDVMFVKYGTIYSIPADYIHLKVPFLWVFLMVVGVVILGFLVSLASCYKILNKNPIECLKYDLKNNSIKFKKKKRKFKKVPISLKMAVRNIKMKPLRTTMATIGIAGCVALLVSGFGVGDTLKNSLKNDLGKVFNYDITTTYNAADFKEKLLKDTRVQVVEDFKEVYVEANFKQNFDDVYVYEIVENSTLSSIKLSGNQVCVSSSIAEDLGFVIGDKIYVRTHEKQVELVVTHIVETSVLNGIYVCKNLGFADSLYSKGVWIKCSADAEQVAVFANTINGTNTAYTIAGQSEVIENRIMSISSMTDTLKTFAVLLAVIVLLNLIFLIIKERTTEIATLKVIGQNSLSIALAVFLEVIFIAAIGMIVGMLLGYPLLLLILAVNKVKIINFIYKINVLSFFASAFIIFATIALVLGVCYYKILKINMAESLKSVE